MIQREIKPEGMILSIYWYIIFFTLFRHLRFHTSSIFIDNASRGKGYGKKIQQGLIDEAKKRNYSFGVR